MKGLRKFLFVFFTLLIVGVGVYLFVFNSDLFLPFYTIQFVSEEVEIEEESMRVKEGKFADLPTPENEQYSFVGWYDENGKEWNKTTAITKDLVLNAKWTLKQFSITFDVDGAKTTQKIYYGQTPIYDPDGDGIANTPTKEQTQSEVFEFSSWSSEITAASKDVVYTAIFSSTPRTYNIVVSSNLNDAAVICGGGKIEYSNGTTLTVTENAGYAFAGWFKDGALYSSSKTLSLSNIHEDISLEAQFSLIVKTITYNGTTGVSNPNPTSYTIKSGENGIITLQNLSKNGYTFEGFFTKSTGGTKVTEINVSNLQNITLYARFSLDSYTISYNLNGGINNSANPSSYSITTPTITLKNPSKPGYTFNGWAEGNTITNGSTGNKTFTASWSIITYTINYNLDGGTNSSENPLTYTIETETITLKNPSKPGYTFNGWVEGNTIAKGSTENKTFTASWSIITYTISYNLDGGSVSSPNKTSFTIETDSFTLTNPTKTEHVFAGWSGTGIDGTVKDITISKGSTGNRTYTANWLFGYIDVSICVDGTILDTIKINCGSTISDISFNLENYGLSHYSIDKYYTNSAMTIEQSSSDQLISDTTLYAKSQYIVRKSFFDYYEKFSSATGTSTIQIESYDELRAFVEYAFFYSLSKDNSPKIEIVYGDLSAMSAIYALVNKLIDEVVFPTVSLGYSIYSLGSHPILKLYSNINLLASKSVYNPSKDGTYSQIQYALYSLTGNRALNFNNFKVNNILKTVEVETTDQLVYALEFGYKPICKTGSDAEDIYNKAKAVLRQICNDSMSDFEKILEIYEWLTQNVYYDHKAADEINDSSWMSYDSWYAEGVFNNGCAVCDAYSKAAVILGRIENIPIIRVTGNNHAWNKVYLNGAWYGFDATHGDLGTTTHREVLTYTNFLFTDAEKTAKTYTAADFTWISATTEINVYDYISFNSNSFDLLINDQDEFELFANYLITQVSSFSAGQIYTFEIAVAYSASTSNLLACAKNCGLSFSNCNSIAKTDVDGHNVYIFIITV